MIKRMAQRGFTLIELLVVIAIIGILAGVVLTSLGSARSSATDSKVKSQLASMRAEAEIYYSASSTYSGVCGTLAKLNSSFTGYDCDDSSTAWAAEASLSAAPAGPGGFWCVDSTGSSRRIAATKNNAVVCP